MTAVGVQAPPQAFEVSPSALLFYLVYLPTIWSFALSMLRRLDAMPAEDSRRARPLAVAHALLASGDTAMFVAFSTVFFFGGPAGGGLGAERGLTLIAFGIFSTSVTMSCFYFFLALYYRRSYAHGRWNHYLTAVVVLFLARLLAHYNPYNVWLSMSLGPGVPNHSAWVRNLPLFAYGLLVVALCLAGAWRGWHRAERPGERLRHRWIGCAMIALAFSFAFYAVDVFFAHAIERSWIWMTYSFKTVAYVAALLAFWRAEFGLARPRLALAGEGPRTALGAAAGATAAARLRAGH